MKRLAQLIEEPITPSAAFEMQIADLEKAAESIAKAVPAIRKKYEEQLKKTPTSWKGIGRGADLARFIKDASELATALQAGAR